MKIQSPYWPSVVHVFWPLTMYSSPSLTAVVRSDARSEPASGSLNPWDHQMSRLAVLARKRSLISSEPKAAMTGPTMLALNASGIGTCAICISSCQMWRCSGVQSLPPHSTGQFGTARPAALRACCDCDDLLLGELATGGYGVADLLRHLGGEERAHLLAESHVFSGQLQMHRNS